MNNEFELRSKKSGNLSKTISEGLTKLFEQISDDVSDRNNCKLFIKRVLAAYNKDEIDKLDKQLSKIPDNLKEIYPKSDEVLRNLRLGLDRMTSERFNSLAEQLKKYAKSKDLSIKGVSPNFVVDDLIEVVLEKQNKAAKVGASYVRNLNWNRILKLLNNEQDRIWKRPIDVIEYRDELLSVYESIMEIKPNPSGWTALTHVYQKLKENREKKNPKWREGGRVASYYKDEFSADLSKLWQAQVREKIPRPHIEFSAIRDPRKAFVVVLQKGETTHYGFIRPRRNQA